MTSITDLYNEKFVVPLGFLIFFAIAIVHPLIHGTFLDMGALDGFFAQLQLFGAGLVQTRSEQ